MFDHSNRCCRDGLKMGFAPGSRRSSDGSFLKINSIGCLFKQLKMTWCDVLIKGGVDGRTYKPCDVLIKGGVDGWAYKARVSIGVRTMWTHLYGGVRGVTVNYRSRL